MSDCYSYCQSYCERHCEDSCESSCERRCESECQENCEKRCQYGCEDCQNSCQNNCQDAAQKNRSPYTPAEIQVPSTVKGGTTLNITWGSVTDPDGNLSGYKLERSSDNKSYIQIYSGSKTSFSDTIDKTWKTVKYRVRAYDTFNSTSSYRESSIIQVVNNSAPTVIAKTLRGKTDFGTITKGTMLRLLFLVQDEDGDPCTVDIFEDEKKVKENWSVTLGINYFHDANFSRLGTGHHTIEIIAKDNKGNVSEPLRFTFDITNQSPVISDHTNNLADVNLGDKSSAFEIPYRVIDDSSDTVNVTILLDNLEIATVGSAQNKDLTVQITDEMLNNFGIGSNHTITIKADDLKGGISYRRWTFTKVNRPPIISGSDENLGNKTDPFSVSFSITDIEHDPIGYIASVDAFNAQVEEENAVDGKTYTYEIPHDDFIRLNYGEHNVQIIATEQNNNDNYSLRRYDFTRVSNGLDIEIKVNEFKEKPKKIIAVPHGTIAEDAIMHVYACNNYLDESPTWEDITTSSKAARAHTFTNNTKTNAKWSIGIKITITNGSSGEKSVIKGFKGGFE